LAIACALIVALIAGALVLFESEVMWDMDSPNAQAWNATLNTSATFGINIIPMLILVVIGSIILGIVSTFRGYR